MDYEGHGRKQSYLNIRHFPGIYTEVLKKVAKNLSRDDVLSRDSIPIAYQI